MIRYEDQALPIQVRKRADSPKSPYYAYFKINGRMKQACTNTHDYEAACMIATQEFLNRQGLERYHGRRARVTGNTVMHWDDIWIQVQRNQKCTVAESTLNALKSKANRYAKFLNKKYYELKETDFNQKNADLFQAQLVDEGKTPGTINQNMRGIQQLAKAAGVKIDFRPLQREYVKYRAPNKNVIDKIWEDRYLLNEYELRMFYLIFGTGMRRHEACHAKWSWVEEERERIYISPYPGFKTKNGRGRMAAFLSSCLKELLKLKRPTEGPDELIMACHTYTNPTYHYTVIGLGLSKYLRERGIGERPDGTRSHGCLHELRKYYGALITKNSDIYSAQTFLGHTDPKLTSEIYSDYIDDGKKFDFVY